MASLPGAFFEKGRSFLPCLFNSFDPYFKQPFGAVRAGQSVHLSLCIPEELGYVDPHLVLQKEGRYDVPVHYRMKFDGQTPHQNHFSVDVTLNDVGLYFYYFDLYTNFRRIVRGPDNCGVVSWQEGESWQITVYEADFETPAPIKGKVFYQIFPDRFCEGVENKPMPFPDRLYQADKHAEPFWQPNEVGGHLNEDYFGGDLKGVQMKLPYLREMGVDYLYLNPIFEAHSNHRYNTADYLNVDPLLGTNEDFETLCAEARKYGIGIVLDGVFSHTGSDSRYFNREGRYGEGGAYRDPNSPYRSWYDFDSKYKGGYRSWWGFETLPEVNEETPSYVEFITGEGGVIDTWLRRGAAGFRLDVADELPDDFIADIRAAMEQEKPDSILLGEVWEDASNKVSYGALREYFLGSELDATMHYPFRTAVLDFLQGKINAQTACDTFWTIQEHYPKENLYAALNLIGSHDRARVLTVLGGDMNALKMAMFLQFALPGVPSIYYGDEAGMTGGTDPYNRGSFPWGKGNAPLTDFVRSLTAMYQETPLLRRGECEMLFFGENVLGCRRFDESGSVLALVNRGEEAVECFGVTVPGREYILE